MKTTIIKLSIVLFLATISTSCNIDMLNRVEGDRNVISEKRQVNEDFSKVKPAVGSKKMAITRILVQFLLMYLAYLMYIIS